MRITFAFLACAFFAFGAVGCVVQYQQPTAEVEAEPVGPVVTGPGVEVIQDEPAPAERVYVYDPGFPPGVYYYNNYYWYGGYRYERDVFVTRYVNVNVRENRYVNVTENRRVGQRIEQQHRVQYAQHGGVPQGRAAHQLRPETETPGQHQASGTTTGGPTAKAPARRMAPQRQQQSNSSAKEGQKNPKDAEK